MNTSTLALEVNQLEKQFGDAYLRLQLEPTTSAVILLEELQEVVVTPVELISYIPNRPECILGLINQRSQAIWVVDLAQMLGLEPINRGETNYQIAIAKIENIPLGLIIRQAKEVIRLNSAQIDSSLKTVKPSLIPYLKGCVLQEQEILLVLNTKAIINSPILGD